MRKRDTQRHLITLEYVISDGMVKTRAVCCCEKLDSPAFFGREKAEEAGEDHLRRRRMNK